MKAAPAKKAAPPASVDAYLKAAPKAARAALADLRQTIRAAAPDAEEVINYQIPMYKQDGNLVSFAAFASHLTFFVQSPAVMQAHAADLKSYVVTKGGVHFSTSQPLPAALVKKLVKARLAENAALAQRKREAKAAKDSANVDAGLRKARHPFTAEVQAVRQIIRNVNEAITEEWKWNAPSFSYKGYLATFNLWEKKRVHLIFHNGAILSHKSGLLEGGYPDRRMVYFADMPEVKAKQAALEKLVKEWVKLMDARPA